MEPRDGRWLCFWRLRGGAGLYYSSGRCGEMENFEDQFEKWAVGGEFVKEEQVTVEGRQIGLSQPRGYFSTPICHQFKRSKKSQNEVTVFKIAQSVDVSMYVHWTIYDMNHMPVDLMLCTSCRKPSPKSRHAENAVAKSIAMCIKKPPQGSTIYCPPRRRRTK